MPARAARTEQKRVSKGCTIYTDSLARSETDLFIFNQPNIGDGSPKITGQNPEQWKAVQLGAVAEDTAPAGKEQLRYGERQRPIQMGKTAGQAP